MTDLIYAELEDGRHIRVDRIDVVDASNEEGFTSIVMAGGYWLTTTLTPDQVFDAMRTAIKKAGGNG